MTDVKSDLEWYIMAGVDSFCADEPMNVIDRNQQQNQNSTAKIADNKAYSAANTTLRPATTQLAQANTVACRNARELCQKAQTLDDLREMMESFEGCALKFSANSTVFGYGNPQAEVMIVGEAPGADEDRKGEPFVGRSGHLLDKMLQAIGLNRDDCYITNILPWRPPGNRTPTSDEVAVCLPFLKRQIALIKPKIIFILGRSAANALLDNSDSITDLRGHFLDYVSENGETIPTLSSYHPAFLLRTTTQKAKAWADLLRLQRKLEEL